MTDPVQAMVEEAYRAPIEGWDFSWLDGHAHQVPPPWDYAQLVRAAAQDAGRTLDIDTGGGELLEELSPFPGFVVATEGHGPNVTVAARRLGPVGIPVVHTRPAPDNVNQVGVGPSLSEPGLPFGSDVFDLVVDRHSSYWPSEVMRVLRGSGRFLTQQWAEVESTGAAWEDLFNRSAEAGGGFDLGFAAGQLVDAGFEIVRAEEADTPFVFGDLTGVVYYLRRVPWAVDGFDPERDRKALEAIHERILADGELRIRGGRMLIEARPGGSGA